MDPSGPHVTLSGSVSFPTPPGPRLQKRRWRRPAPVSLQLPSRPMNGDAVLGCVHLHPELPPAPPRGKTAGHLRGSPVPRLRMTQPCAGLVHLCPDQPLAKTTPGPKAWLVPASPFLYIERSASPCGQAWGHPGARSRASEDTAEGHLGPPPSRALPQMRGGS